MDDFSKDNAVILHQSLRFSLLIDPQGQAARWLKTAEAERMQVVKQTDALFVRQVGLCWLAHEKVRTLC